MSTITLPDPYPGRCRNHRTVSNGVGHIETLRCLDYENVEHVCSFPEPIHTGPALGGMYGGGTFTTAPPKPWVKP